MDPRLCKTYAAPGDPAFDFEGWARLARTDPDAFETRRRVLIDTFIETAPPAQQRRLRGLQFRIDMERRRARTPLAACIRLSSMMWDMVVGPGGLVDLWDELGSERPATPPTRARPAQVLPFPGGRRRGARS